MSKDKLDTIDIGILNILQKDARLTNKQIAGQTNRSLSTVQVRIRRLQEIGIIKKFITLLDRSKINREMAVFTMIKLTSYGQSALNEFQESVSAFEEVMECYHMSGGHDYLLKVVVRDISAYHSFIQQRLSTVPHLGAVESLFVISEVKSETAFNLNIK